MEAQPEHEKEMLEWKQERAKAEENLLGIQEKQMQNIKELKDGYLDAVQAMAFGAGRFEKIIITQEKNVGAALDRDIAKKNARLGMAGKAAARGAQVNPFRFTTKLGQMEGMGGISGKNMDQAAIERQQAAYQDKLVDPYYKDIANKVTNVYSAAREYVQGNTSALQMLTNALTGFSAEIDPAVSARAAQSAGMGKGIPSDVAGEQLNKAGKKGGTSTIPGAGASKTSSGKYGRMMGEAARYANALSNTLVRIGNEIDQEFAGDTQTGSTPLVNQNALAGQPA